MATDLLEKLNDDLKQAMRDRDNLKRLVIRTVLSAVHYAEIARKSSLEDSDVLGILAKEVRQRQESIVAFKKGNRPDLVTKEEAEMVILADYLPEQIMRDEIITEARRIIEEVGAQGPGDKGKVMSKIVALLKGKADGREINEVVTELLNA